MQVPAIAVLLATYNGSAHCRAQIASILWQQGVDIHLYVRDDGSRDTTLDILQEWALRYPKQLTIIHNEGISTGSANGSFFKLLASVDFASYDFVALADQDDVWTPYKLLRATTRTKPPLSAPIESIAFDQV